MTPTTPEAHAPTATARAAIVFDDSCNYCRRQIAWIERNARPNAFEFVPRSNPDLLTRFPRLANADLNTGLRFIRPDGVIFVGADGVYQIARRLPLHGFLAWLYLVPGLRQLFRAAYAWVAANRYRLAGRCDGGACEAPQRG